MGGTIPAGALILGESQLRQPHVDPAHRPLERPHALTLEPPVR